MQNVRRKKIGVLILAGWLVLVSFNMTVVRARVERSLENSSRRVLLLNGQSAVNVDARGLTVKLSGFVESPEDRDRAVELVKARFGVRRVENNLVIDAAKAAAPQLEAPGTLKPGSAGPTVESTGNPPVSRPDTTAVVRGPTIEVIFRPSAEGDVETVEVRGVVPDTASKDALFARLSNVVPVERIASNVQFPTGPTELPDMQSYRRLGSFLEVIAKTKAPDVVVSYKDGSLSLSGSMGDAGDLALVRAEARNLVGAGTLTDSLLATSSAASPSEQPEDQTSTTKPPTQPAVPSMSEQPGSVGRTDTPAATAAQTAVDAVIGGKVIAFEKNRARLTTEGRSVLNSLATVLLKSGDASVKYEISGHTDDVGSDDANLDLSTRRAEAVREALVAKGVPAERLVTRGYGESRPVASNDTEEGRSTNRRIEVRAQS